MGAFLRAVLAAGLLMGAAQASTVTVTITGTVLTGGDNGGNVFTNSGQPTDLTGAPFTLVYTFDDTQGVDVAGQCNGAAAWSSVSTNVTNPGTAALTINGGTFRFGNGSLGQASVNSSFAVQKYGCPAGVGQGFGPESTASVEVSVTYSGDGGSDMALIGGGPLTAPNAAANPGLIASFDWRSAIQNAPLDPTSLALSADAYVTYAGKTYNFGLIFAPTAMSVSGAPSEVLTGFTAIGTNMLSQTSGATLNVSSGDVPSLPAYPGNYLTYLPTPTTAYLNPVATATLTSNPMSECTGALSLMTTPNWNGMGGFGVAGSLVQASSKTTGTCAVMPGKGTSPSGIFTISAKAGVVAAKNNVTVIMPPQVMIQTEVGEAGAQTAKGDAAMPSLLLVAGNRFGDSDFPPLSHSWQTTLSDPKQFYGDKNETLNGVYPELDYAAAIFNGTTTITLPAACECYWSPTDAQFAGIMAAYKSGTTIEPANVGAPGCWAGKKHQIVIKTSVQNNRSVKASLNSPAFVFYQVAPAGSKAVIEIP